MPPKKGRCFRCHKKGHVAAHYRSKRTKNASGLPGLPSELLSLIATHVMDEKWMSWPDHLFALRLTCRAIYQKTNDVFAKAAFGRLIVRIDTPGFNRLTGISQCPVLAKQVRWIMLSQYDRIRKEEVVEAEKTAASPELSRRERREAQNLVWRANIEQDDKDFIDRSGTASIVLSAAFGLLPNLQEITISCDKRDREQRYTRFSATKAFSILSACLPFTGGKLQKLDFMWIFASLSRGVSLQALCLPQPSLACFSDLRVLNLLIQVQDGDSYRNIGKWNTSASKFLVNCPQLRKLSLGSGGDWEETVTVFSHIARKAVFPHLTDFKLDFLRCRGQDLLLFMSNHKDLESISLENLDIIGTVSYREVLNCLQHHHSKLKEFKCRQIAENSLRLFFEAHGMIECQGSPMARLRPDKDEEPDFFSDFANVAGPFKYIGEAEEWEGVQNKIGVLKDDIRVSDQDYHSELALHGSDSYHWLS